MTRIVTAEEGLAEAAELINKGELVVFPTETVYGLGADAFNDDAVKKIFAAKGRPQDNPLIVHISRLDQISDIAVGVPDSFYLLADKFMPGPLTLVLKKNPKIPFSVTAGGDTVAVRMPAAEIARKLIEMSAPLAAPSANRSKHVSPTTARHVYDDLAGEVELILDGGPCGVGIESTVLDLTSDIPTVLRPGYITAAELSEIVGDVGENGRVIKIAKAPGMKYEHYAPKIPCVIARNPWNAVSEYDRMLALGKQPVLLFRDIHKDVTDGRTSISLGVTEEDYTRNIYSALRQAENIFDYIIIEELEGDGLAASVMNRVEKAAGGRRV